MQALFNPPSCILTSSWLCHCSCITCRRCILSTLAVFLIDKSLDFIVQTMISQKVSSSMVMLQVYRSGWSAERLPGIQYKYEHDYTDELLKMILYRLFDLSSGMLDVAPILLSLALWSWSITVRQKGRILSLWIKLILSFQCRVESLLVI